MHPFTFYDSTYHLLTVMMSYIFRAIRLYPVSEELEAEMQKLERDLGCSLGNHQLGQKRMTGLRGGCTGCRGADGALPKASKIQKERHLLSADVSLSRRDGQNRYFKISKRYRRPTPPAFWPAGAFAPHGRFAVDKTSAQAEFTSAEHLNHRRAGAASLPEPKEKGLPDRKALFSLCARRDLNPHVRNAH